MLGLFSRLSGGELSARKRDWMSQTKKIVLSGTSLATEGMATSASTVDGVLGGGDNDSKSGVG